jgi:hypothetical protein
MFFLKVLVDSKSLSADFTATPDDFMPPTSVIERFNLL